VQSIGLGLDQKALVLVLGNFWSLGLGLETKVLVLKKKSYLHLCLVWETWLIIKLDSTAESYNPCIILCFNRIISVDDIYSAKKLQYSAKLQTLCGAFERCSRVRL